MSADVIYPAREYTDSVESVSKIRELLLDNNKDPLIILVGETDWPKLDNWVLSLEIPVREAGFPTPPLFCLLAKF